MRKYLKIGSLSIPYSINIENTKKTLHFGRITIPFSNFEKNGHVYYKIGFVKFRIPGREKLLVSQSHMNYEMREQWDEKKIELVARKIFEEKQGYPLDLENPKTMNEKIFWLKLNYHDPMVTKCCDKFCVKEYVEDVLGPGYSIPTIQSWDRAEDIDFSRLPEQYVLKVNWSSGYNIIVKDKTIIDEQEIRKKVAHWMKPEQNSYYQTYNWGYKNMKPVVYAEEYMEQIAGQLYDYKFFCCNGKVNFWFIATDRYEDGKLTHDFFDMNFNKLEFDYGGRAHSTQKLEKPRFYEEMLRCAERLSKPFPFVRVDFYEIGDAFYVGEMTFYPGGGVLKFDPLEWDYKLGEYIILPEKMTEEDSRTWLQTTEEHEM